mgnify:CR=1 FL=1
MHRVRNDTTNVYTGNIDNTRSDFVRALSNMFVAFAVRALCNNLLLSTNDVDCRVSYVEFNCETQSSAAASAASCATRSSAAASLVGKELDGSGPSSKLEFFNVHEGHR